jgi:hypothetical protein
MAQQMIIIMVDDIRMLVNQLPRVACPDSMQEMLEREKMIADMPGTWSGCSANTLVAYIQDPKKVEYISPGARADHLGDFTLDAWHQMIMRVQTMLDNNVNPALTLTNELRLRSGQTLLI